jgi:carbonic anhydrase
MHMFRMLCSTVALSAVLVACSKPAPEATSQAEATGPVRRVLRRAVKPPANAAHWDYEADGPDRWGSLSPDFAACGAGKRQSPIDLHGAKPARLTQLLTRFQPAELRVVHHEHMADVVNTGHSVQVNAAGGDTVTIGDERFVLLQYHFHSPSEHHVDGRAYPAEMHLVHKAADGKLAVIGVLFEEGAANPALDPIWANLPSAKGEESHLPHVTVNADDLLPMARASYRYSGSLTTPPCSEDVTWIVMSTPVTMSSAQLAQLRQVLAANNRPVQPLNGRPLVLEGVEERPAQQ